VSYLNPLLLLLCLLQDLTLRWKDLPPFLLSWQESSDLFLVGLREPLWEEDLLLEDLLVHVGMESHQVLDYFPLEDQRGPWDAQDQLPLQ